LVASGAYGGVMIGRRGEPTAAIIPSDLATALLEPGDTKRTWAAIIVARLLGGAPPHLKAPALEELSRLPKTDLDRLLGIERLPLTKSQSATLQAKLAHPEALARLVKRFELATAIRKAREIGLYEVAEDAMSSLIGVAGETSGGS
jgi:hypothetical protein